MARGRNPQCVRDQPVPINVDKSGYHHLSQVGTRKCRRIEVNSNDFRRATNSRVGCHPCRKIWAASRLLIETVSTSLSGELTGDVPLTRRVRRALHPSEGRDMIFPACFEWALGLSVLALRDAPLEGRDRPESCLRPTSRRLLMRPHLSNTRGHSNSPGSHLVASSNGWRICLTSEFQSVHAQ